MNTTAYRLAAVLWVVWGLVHLFAGVITIQREAATAVSGIADAVDPAVLTGLSYHPAAGALINQHGWNLAWIGLTTILCAPWVWKGAFSAIALAALVGGLADVGYFLFLDLGGFVHFVPGTVMTIFSGAAIALSFGAHLSGRGKAEGGDSNANASGAVQTP